MKGRLSGGVLSKNKGGWYARSAKQFPQNKSLGTFANQAVQAKQQRWINLTQSWKNVTELNQLTWSTNAYLFPTTDKFGNTRIPTGYELYCRLNGALLLIGSPIQQAAPSPVSITVASPASCTTFSSSAIMISWSHAIADNEVIQTYASAPCSKGSSLRKGNLKFIKQRSASAFNNMDIYGEYVSKYGVPVTGSRVWFCIVVVNSTTGQKGAPFYFNHDTLPAPTGNYIITDSSAALVTDNGNNLIWN